MLGQRELKILGPIRYGQPRLANLIINSLNQLINLVNLPPPPLPIISQNRHSNSILVIKKPQYRAEYRFINFIIHFYFERSFQWTQYFAV